MCILCTIINVSCLQMMGETRGVPSLSTIERDYIHQHDWINTTVAMLSKWFESSCERANKHETEGVRYHMLNRVIKIPELLVGGTATAIAFWVVGNDDSSPSAKVWVAVLSGVSIVLKGLDSVFGFAELEQRHVVAAGQYHDLSRKIEVNLHLPQHLRPNARVLVEEVSMKYTQTLSTSPSLKI